MSGSYYHTLPRLRVTLLQRDGDDAWLLAFASGDSASFHAAIDTVKALPLTMREYLVAERCWWITDAGLRQLARRIPVIDGALRIAQGSVGEEAEADPWVQQARQAAAAPIVPPDVRDALAGMHLLPSAPASVVQAVYRTLAKQHHPDRGGRKETMQRLNAHYEKAISWARSRKADPAGAA